jgi:hypothetical protein
MTTADLLRGNLQHLPPASETVFQNMRGCRGEDCGVRVPRATADDGAPVHVAPSGVRGAVVSM